MAGNEYGLQQVGALFSLPITEAKFIINVHCLFYC